jgi:hypothetical protein
MLQERKVCPKGLTFDVLSSKMVASFRSYGLYFFG